MNRCVIGHARRPRHRRHVGVHVALLEHRSRERRRERICVTAVRRAASGGCVGGFELSCFQDERRGVYLVVGAVVCEHERLRIGDGDLTVAHAQVTRGGVLATEAAWRLREHRETRDYSGDNNAVHVLNFKHYFSDSGVLF